MYARNVVIGLAMLAFACAAAQADFTLTGSEHMSVTTKIYATGNLYDNSTIEILNGGYVDHLYAQDSTGVSVSGGGAQELGCSGNSSVSVSGGVISILHSGGTSSISVSGGTFGRLTTHISSKASVTGGTFSGLRPYGDSSVSFDGGYAQDVTTYNSSTMAISGGSIGGLLATDTSSVYFSGGSTYHLGAQDEGTVTLKGYDFQVADGLVLEEFDVVNGVAQYRVVGTGVLSGKWADSTSWLMTIDRNIGNATILAIPEPATLSLLALGGLAVIRRRRR